MEYTLRYHLTEGPCIEGLPDNREIIYCAIREEPDLEFFVLEREKGGDFSTANLHVALKGSPTFAAAKTVAVSVSQELLSLFFVLDGREGAFLVPDDREEWLRVLPTYGPKIHGSLVTWTYDPIAERSLPKFRRGDETLLLENYREFDKLHT